MESPKKIFLTNVGSYSSWSESRRSDEDVEYVKYGPKEQNALTKSPDTQYQKFKVQRIIKSLNESDVYIEHIFMRGGCYKLFLFLQTIYPEAEPYIHQNKDHVVTKLFGRLFDIRGIIETKFESLYSPMDSDDVEMANSWSFSRNQVLQLCECPQCGEPIVYNDL